MIIKTSIFKLGNFTLQPRTYYTQIKNKKDLPVKILQFLPNKLPDRKYFIIDHTVTSQGVEHLYGTIGKKQAIIYLIQQIKSEFKKLKTEYPNYENIIIFNIINEDGLYDIIRQFPIISKVETLNFFDRIGLVAVCVGTDATTFIPILHFDQKGDAEFLKNNLVKVSKALSLAVPPEINIKDSTEAPPVDGAAPISPTAAETDPQNPPPALNDITTNIINDTISDNIKKDLESEMFKITAEVDSARLSKVLKNYKIQDEIVANNIKLVVNEYLEKNKNKEIEKKNLEDVVLKSIHFSLFGTDEVKDIYKANPELLISKLEESETFSKHITYPEPIHQISLVSPKDVVQINRITGPVRHKFEFNENIHSNIKTLFKSLEQKTNFPVKVQKFSYDYYDDNLNRFIEYTITLKNISGGAPEPYDVKIRIPALVNDKYFKLNGQEYILSSQQFLHPLTKDKNSEARFLSHYGMIRLRTVNMRFNISQIDEVINYIRLKYPILIDSIDTDINGKVSKIQFIDPKQTIIDLNSSTPFKNTEKEIYLEESQYFIKDLKTQKSQKVNKSEYIFDYLLNLIKDIDPNEELKKSKKSIPYLEVFVMSRKMAFIIYLWQQIGLINALTKFNIKYEIAAAPSLGVPDVNLLLNNGNYLYIYGDTKKEELIVNGLLTLPKDIHFTDEQLNDKTALDNYINEKYGTRTIETLNLATANFIDPVTNSLLQYQDLPDNLIDIVCGPLTDKLLNDSVDALNDLRTLRVRQSEQMTHILYKELSMAHNKYTRDLQYGIENATMYLDPNYVSDNLIGKHMHAGNDGGSALTYVNMHNPVDEITQSSKIIKTGVGGVPSKRSFNKFHRGIHPTYIGNIGAHESTEYSNVGLINFHTLGSVISNRYGFYGNVYIDPESDHMNSLGIGEALIPFVDQFDSDRLFLAR
jgi:hypothetical protein